VTEAKRRLLWPSLMTALMLIVLLGLGTWQVRRLIWKEDLLAQIERAEASAPVPLPPLASLSGASPSTLSPLTPSLSPFMKVSATGTFLADSVALYGADVRTIASGPVMGARMIEPLREANGDVILVDRGWGPLSPSPPIDQPSGAITVSGNIRQAIRLRGSALRTTSSSAGFSPSIQRRSAPRSACQMFRLSYLSCSGRKPVLDRPKNIGRIPHAICHVRQIVIFPTLSHGMDWPWRCWRYSLSGPERDRVDEGIVRLRPFG